MIFDLFSRRNRNSSKEIFTYDILPKEFRIQVIHIWVDALGNYYNSFYGESEPSNKIWEFIHKQLCKEYGIFVLSQRGNSPFEKCQYFIQEAEIERTLDIIELTFRYIDKVMRTWDTYEFRKAGLELMPDEAIFELNQRFREHGIGYQFIKSQIIRVDSDYIFTEAVEPAVNLLFEEEFEGASQEFLSAHEHFPGKEDIKGLLQMP